MIGESNKVNVKETITLNKFEGDIDEDGNPGPDAVLVETMKIEDGKVVEIIDRRPDKKTKES